MHCLYNYQIKSAVMVSLLCSWIKMRRNVEYRSKKKMVTTSSDGLNRQLRVPSEIYQLQSSWRGWIGWTAQQILVERFRSFLEGGNKVSLEGVAAAEGVT